ncbi:hypothetical protein Mal48_23240 [Thalassoglobus polymorphus]|uniref:Uncharacterized protein n=1 Tax=Thalassoglobus polymorphus TaxID=2527994 RepID=A0A517QN63_9PLAN|nr:hypothetical protein Mal48_23240 [Thalassoglobus polymorphus]
MVYNIALHLLSTLRAIYNFMKSNFTCTVSIHNHSDIPEKWCTRSVS